MITYEIEFNDKSLIKNGSDVVGVRAAVVGSKGAVTLREPFSVDKAFGSDSAADLAAELELLPEFAAAVARIESRFIQPKLTRGAVVGNNRISALRSRA